MSTRWKMSLCFFAGVLASSMIPRVTVQEATAAEAKSPDEVTLPNPPNYKQDPKIQIISIPIHNGLSVDQLITTTSAGGCPRFVAAPAGQGGYMLAWGARRDQCVALVTDQYVRQLVSASIASALRKAALEQVADERVTSIVDSRIQSSSVLNANAAIQDVIARLEALERKAH